MEKCEANTPLCGAAYSVTAGAIPARTDPSPRSPQCLLTLKDDEMTQLPMILTGVSGLAALTLLVINTPWSKLRRPTTPKAAGAWPTDKNAPPEFATYVAAIEEVCVGMAAGDVLCVVASGISPRAAGVVKAVHG